MSALTGGIPGGTRAEDYGSDYYQHYAGGAYDVTSPHWLRFFDGIAARLVTMFGPASSLDAGCAKGILVGSLSALGVEAHGIDLSPVAIEGGDPRAGDRLRVGSLTEPLDRTFDLITCIEVIEHLSQPDAESALDHLCAATDLLVLSSTPREFAEVTHVNVRAGGHWAAMLQDRGFVRRFDVDLEFISPWAAAFERRHVASRALVHEYETALVTVRTEVADKRQVLLETQQRLDRARVATVREQELASALLTVRDVARGSEAQAGTATRRADQAQGELDAARAVIDGMQASLSWKLGRFLTAPFRWVRAAVRILT